MSKKILFTLMSLAVVLSMLLAACAPAATEVPQATEPPAPEVTEPPVEATEPPVEATEPPVEATEPPAVETTNPPRLKPATSRLASWRVCRIPSTSRCNVARQAAADRLGVELVVQIPDNWDVTVQTPMLDAMVARGDLNGLFLAPTDKEGMVAPLQKVIDAGIAMLTVDTFIGDGDYDNGPVTIPLSYIGSNNVQGGEIACRGLAEAIGKKGKVYIQNTVPNVSTTDQRQEGCEAALKEFPDITLIGTDFNDDDPAKAQAQTQATLERNPDLAGIFGTNVYSAQGAGQAVINAGLSGKVKVVAFDATEFAIEKLRDKTVDLVIAQKPYDMGYLAVEMLVAYLDGVSSIPKRMPTGYQIITATMWTTRQLPASSTPAAKGSRPTMPAGRSSPSWPACRTPSTTTCNGAASRRRGALASS